jgi:ankyrin repeat protein
MISTPQLNNDNQQIQEATTDPLQDIMKGIEQQYKDTGSIDLEYGKSVLLQCAYNGDVSKVAALLSYGVPLETTHKFTGMTALHWAVGCNHLELVRFLVERGALFVPDKQGRMPTTIAAECEVSEELCDFIVEAEAAAEARAEGV